MADEHRTTPAGARRAEGWIDVFHPPLLLTAKNETLTATGEPQIGSAPRDPGTDERGR